MKKVLFILLFMLFVLVFTYKQPDSNTYLKFSSWGSQSEYVVIKKIIDKFEEENPDIKIEFIHIPQNYFQKIHLLFASNLEPDVIFINNRNIKMYENAGLLENLSGYFPESNNIFFPASIECFKNNDDLYAIPRDISNLVLYYNKDILKAHNIELPLKIENINDLQHIAKKLTTPEYFGINSEDNPLFWSYYLASNGGGILSDDVKSVIINSKQSMEALNLYADMSKKYHIAPSKSQIGSMTTAQMFINGKLALYLGGRWIVPKFKETISFDWDIAAFPASDNGKVYVDASGWAISSKSKHKNEAVKFVKYLASKESIDEFAKSGLIIPARKDSIFAIQSENKTAVPEHNIIFTDMLKYAKPTPVNENYSAVDDILKEKMQIILESNKTPETVFDEKTIKKIESLL